MQELELSFKTENIEDQNLIGLDAHLDTVESAGEDFLDPEDLMPEIVEGLLKAAEVKTKAPTFEQIKYIVDYLFGRYGELVKSPEVVAQEIGLTVREVFDVVFDLGAFIGFSRKEAVKAAQPHTKAEKATLAVLFDRMGKKIPKVLNPDQLMLMPVQTAEETVITFGWD